MNMYIDLNYKIIIPYPGLSKMEGLTVHPKSSTVG